MGKDSKKREEKPKESEFKKFVKKRAPIYLAVITLVIVFVIPELTKGSLENSIPDTLSDQDKQILYKIMKYQGPNEKGLSIMDAISQKISEEYPNEKIYDNKKTSVDVSVKNIEDEKYNVILSFKSYKGELNYNWDINLGSGDITGNNPETKHIIDLVDFYD